MSPNIYSMGTMTSMPSISTYKKYDKRSFEIPGGRQVWDGSPVFTISSTKFSWWTYLSALALFKICNNPTVSSDLLHNATQFRLVSSAVNSTIYFLITQYIFYPNCHSGPQSWENKDKHYSKVYDSLTRRISTSHSLFLAGLLLGVFLLLFGYKYSMQTFN